MGTISVSRIPVLRDRRAPVLHVMRPEHTVAAAASRMAEARVGAVAVHQGGMLVGIFTERDLLCRVVAAKRRPEETELRDVMTLEPVTAAPTELRREAISKMRRLNCRHLPIVCEGRLEDMASIRDLLYCELDEYTWEVDSLRSYINGIY